MPDLNKTDLLWLQKFVTNYRYVLDTYPELFNEDDIDDIKIVAQILEEKINE